MSSGQFTVSGGQELSPLVRLLNEMQMSTRKFTLSSGQAFSPLVRLVRLGYHYTGSLADKTSDKTSKSP